MTPGSARPLSSAASRPSSAARRSPSVLSFPRRTSSSSAWVSSTVAGTPKSASIRTRSIRSRSSALSPRISAPTSVMATRLMRLHRLSFLSVSLPLAMPKLTLVLAQPQPPSRDPLAGQTGHAKTEQPEPVPGGLAVGCRRRPRLVRPEGDRAAAIAPPSTPRPPPCRPRRRSADTDTRREKARRWPARFRRSAACLLGRRPSRSRRRQPGPADLSRSTRTPPAARWRPPPRIARADPRAESAPPRSQLVVAATHVR